jgi:hypothetical protein
MPRCVCYIIPGRSNHTKTKTAGIADRLAPSLPGRNQPAENLAGDGHQAVTLIRHRRLFNLTKRGWKLARQ